MRKKASPLVGIIMGSQSDWETMQHAVAQLDELGVPHEAEVVSAHRTPDLLFEYAAQAAERGLEVIIAGAGGAAHLPGMCAAKTSLPVLGVPIESKTLKGMDSLLSIVQMPGGCRSGPWPSAKPEPSMRPCSPRRSSGTSTRSFGVLMKSSDSARPRRCFPTASRARLPGSPVRTFRTGDALGPAMLEPVAAV
jgi:phosphoribosylaminoimidazole carboxylase PurE protein